MSPPITVDQADSPWERATQDDSQQTQDYDVSLLFAGKRAWFSTSVDKPTKQLWEDYGGIKTNFDDADFIFSADNTSADTLRVFTSKPFLMQHLTVFHSQFISDMVQQWHNTGTQAVLGHYILPPQDILNDIRKIVRLRWDVAEHQNQSTRSRPVANGTNHGRSPNKDQVDPMEVLVVDITKLRKVQAEAVSDFIPNKNGAEICHKTGHRR